MHLANPQNSFAGTYMVLGLLFSTLLHAVLASLFLTETKTVEVVPEARVFRVSLAQEDFVRELAESQQLVSQPDVEEEPEVVPETRFLSERDTAVTEEQVKRGDPDAGPEVGERPATDSPLSSSKVEARTTVPQPATEEPRPLRHLTLDRSRTMERFATDPQQVEQDNSATEQIRDMDSYSPFSRPRGSGAQFLGLRGSRDFLPDLPDGDITLLNTKADKFAVFVRRVASRVFGQLRLSGWESLRPEDIRMINRFSTVRAVLSLDGELLSVRLEESSGSRRFDDILLESVSRSAKDYNPPADAVADDGNIHFIFKARSWTRPVSDARTGGFSERRWLLLGTGLD